MTQPPLYVPASAGWFPRPGDPPNHLRYWDGRQWLCNIRGAERDHFDYLRSMAPETRSPQDQAQLTWLAGEVSRIEDLVLYDPQGSPPLVVAPQFAPSPAPMPPYAQGPGPRAPWSAPQAYAPTAKYAQAGRSVGSVPRRKSRLGRGIALVAVGILVVVGKVLFGYAVSGATEAATLKVGACVTISYPVNGTAADDLTYASADCGTKAGGKVSYAIVSKTSGTTTCDPDADSFHTYYSNRSVVEYTYCLMANLTKGECLYIDDKDFIFDVACTDAKAVMKVTKVEDKGSGIACAAKESAVSYPSSNRSYCLGAPK